MTLWAVIDIGCIECGEENLAEDLLRGVFSTREEAVAKVAALRPKESTAGEPHPGWVESSPCGGFSMTDWQVRILEIGEK